MFINEFIKIAVIVLSVIVTWGVAIILLIELWGRMVGAQETKDRKNGKI